MAVPTLHRCDLPIAALGPWEPAQRYWRGNDPEFDVVARSVDGKRLLVGEVKWSQSTSRRPPAAPRHIRSTLPVPNDRGIVKAMFVPDPPVPMHAETGAHLVGAKAVMEALLARRQKTVCAREVELPSYERRQSFWVCALGTGQFGWPR